MFGIKHFFKKFFLYELIQGMKVTGSHLFRGAVTVNYPEESIPKSSRFRGLHALRRYSGGEERCIACKLCEVICPALAITIESEIKNDGSRRTTVYDIDLFKCIYCGFCQEACPVDAIVETSFSEFYFDKNSQRVINKEQLLLNGEIYKRQIDKSLLEASKFV